MLTRALNLYDLVLTPLNRLGAFLPQLALRLLLAWEFWESGLSKFQGENWFSEIQSAFPFPFYLLPVELSWQMSTWFELVGAAALGVGLGTRFFSLSLIVLTAFAWIAVHSGNGYNVCGNGYKLPVIYLVMLIPLFVAGAGKLSVDCWLRHRCSKSA